MRRTRTVADQTSLTSDQAPNILQQRISKFQSSIHETGQQHFPKHPFPISLSQFLVSIFSAVLLCCKIKSPSMSKSRQRQVNTKLRKHNRLSKALMLKWSLFRNSLLRFQYQLKKLFYRRGLSSNISFLRTITLVLGLTSKVNNIVILM